MNQAFDNIDAVVTAISGVLYKPYIVPLFLLAAGLFFTFRSRFVQIRLLGESFRVVKEKPKTAGNVSSFGALMISTASRVGTGNIVGVGTAITVQFPPLQSQTEGFFPVRHIRQDGLHQACGLVASEGIKKTQRKEVA